ncbi:MAG: hypothetical protein WCT54_05900 [Patescibacteria group bacterium]
MPIKRRPASRVQSVPHQELKLEVTRAKSSFWTVFVFMLLFAALFIVGSTTVLLYEQQLGIVNFVDSSLGRTNTPSMQGSYQESAVKGLFIYYKPCPSTFTGACDDASLYRLAADGSKEVIVSSVRNILQAPVTSELLQPIEQSVGGQYIIFGAWAYGSERNPMDQRVWVYDTLTGQTIVRANVPKDSVFSPDYKYAANPVRKDTDVKEIQIVDMASNSVVKTVDARESYTFVGTNGYDVQMRWEDAKDLYVPEYVKDTNNIEAVREIHVTLK